MITGCNAADFAGFPAGNIALISRGACTFAIKATNAYAAGASGVIIYNNIPGALNGTLGNGFVDDAGKQSIIIRLAAFTQCGSKLLLQRILFSVGLRIL